MGKKISLNLAMARSLRVAPECIPIVRQALTRRGFPSQNALAMVLGLSRSTISSFSTGKPVYFINFVEISERLGLDWEDLIPPWDIPQPSVDPDSPKNPEAAPEIYNNRGLENYLAQRVPQAISDFSKALELDPDFAETHYNLGSLYEDLRDFDRARSEYRLAILGGLTAAYNNLARLYILEKDYAAAVDLLLKGLKLAQLDAEKSALQKNLGWARLEQGRYAEAKAELLTAIDLDRKQAAAYGLLAQALEGLGEKVEALVAWENCLRYASSYRPDEDTWIDLARQRLAKLGN
ncbi:MAG TPA: tetratricopeptide repeat protein [Cyanophyceae cyanobacterium]